MKKIQLSRMLMIATILLLAVFEGYWLDKLYRDEYRNIQYSSIFSLLHS